MPSKKIGALSAELVLEIQNFLSPIKNAQAELKEFDKLAQPLTKTIDAVGESLISAGKAATISFTVPLVAAGTLAVKSWNEQSKAIALMENAIRSTGDASGKTSQQLQDMASSLQKNSIFGDEKILQGVVTQLLTFTNIAGTAFDRATQAALDMSTVLGKDLQSSALALGKALNDPVAGVTALQRLGVKLSETQKEQVKSFMAVNDVASAQAVILAEVEKEFGGAAEAASKAGLGPFTQLANKLDDLGEKFGKLILEDLTPLLKYLNDAVDYLDSTSDSTKTLIVSIAAFAAGIGPVLLGLGAMALSLNQIIGVYGQLVIWIPKAAAAAQAAGITMAAAANAVPWIALAAELIYIIKLLDDIASAKRQQASMDAQTASLQQKNIDTLHKLGIEYDAAGKSVGQVNAETAKLLQNYYNTAPAATIATQAVKQGTFVSKEYNAAIADQQKIETAWRAVQSELYRKQVDEAGKFIDAWLKGFQVTSAEADKFTDAIQRAEVKTSELAYTSVDAAVVISGAMVKAHDAWDEANGKTFDKENKLFNDINGLRETDVDLTLKAATERVKADEKATDEQIQQAQKYHDAFIDAIANLNTRIAESFADMIVHAKFNMDSLISIAQDTASKMLSAFLSGLLSPLTSALANVGKSLGDTLFGAAGGTGGLGGIVGGLIGGGGATGTGIGGATSTALGAAGFTADAVIPGTGGLGAIGGLLTNPITLGIGAAVAGVVAWVKSQAHWEANDLVKNFQNPFDAQVAGLVSQIVNNQDALSSADVRGAYTQIHDLWQNTIDTIQNWAAGSSDRGTVASQFFGTEVPVMQGLFDWLGSLDAGKRAVGLATGTPYVPYDNFPAMLHKGEAVVPAAQNPWAGGLSGLTVNINMESGAVFDEGIFRSKVLPMLELVLKNNTSGIAATTTLAVKRNWNSVVMA